MKLIEDLPERMEKVKEMFLKYLEELKKKNTETNYTITKLKYFRRNQ